MQYCLVSGSDMHGVVHLTENETGPQIGKYTVLTTGLIVIYTGLIHDDDVCKSTYLVDLANKKLFLTGPLVPLQLEIISNQEIIATSQNIVLVECKPHRFMSNWTHFCKVYDNLNNASQQLLQIGFTCPELMPLSDIKKGYLASLLSMHKRGLKVAPLYNLDKEWTALLDLHNTIKGAPVRVHILLIKYNVLSYFDVNKHIIVSLVTGNWENIRRILKYYGDRNPFVNYKTIQTSVSGYNISAPEVISLWLKKNNITSIPRACIAYSAKDITDIDISV
jgi:hypothetical protein